MGHGEVRLRQRRVSAGGVDRSGGFGPILEKITPGFTLVLHTISVFHPGTTSKRWMWGKPRPEIDSAPSKWGIRC